MLRAIDFLSACISRGYTFFTGVPCSFLRPLINCVIQNNDVSYIAGTSEGEAVGVAVGAYLAGRKAVVICQNSGLGNMVNPLTSLNYPFRIPILLIITLRGEPGLNDEPQHELMGQITGKLLDTLRIPWTFFPDKLVAVDEVLDQAEKKMMKTGLPFALLMRKGSLDKLDLVNTDVTSLNIKYIVPSGQFIIDPDKRMSRLESIRLVSETISYKDALIATTGKIGRELFTLGDKENQLYIVGSMGCASSIGLGVQYVKREQYVVVLDGDGAALMKMGTFAAIGYNRPTRLIHVILDNESYESTGGQYSVSPIVDFCNIASACGYQQCYRVDTKEELINAIYLAKSNYGPSIIHVKTSVGSITNLGRPTITPCQAKERFMKFLEQGTKK